MEWSGGDGDGDDDDDDPIGVQLDDSDDGYNLPSPGRNFPGRLLPTGELFSLASFHPVEAAELFVDDSFCLRVTGGRSTRKGAGPGGPGPPQAPPGSPLLATSIIWDNRNLSMISVRKGASRI